MSSQIENDEFHGYACAKERVRMLLSRKPNFPMIPSNITLCDPTSVETLSLNEFIKLRGFSKKVTFLKKPEVVKTVACPYDEGWAWPFNMSAVDDNSVIITDTIGKTVTIAYKTDQPAKKVQVPTGYGDIKDTVVFGNSVYFIFKECIVQKLKSEGIEETMLKPAVSNIRRCLILSSSCFVLLCDTQVDIFYSNTRHTKKVVDNLSDPKSITLGYPDGKKIFVVACRGSNEVFVYDDSWNRLYTLGGLGSADGRLQHPYDTAFIQNRLIVADANNFRLCVFDFNGKFETHLMKNCKGFPDGIVYCYPYMWIAENKKGNYPKTISLFRICKDS